MILYIPNDEHFFLRKARTILGHAAAALHAVAMTMAVVLIVPSAMHHHI